MCSVIRKFSHILFLLVAGPLVLNCLRQECAPTDVTCSFAAESVFYANLLNQADNQGGTTATPTKLTFQTAGSWQGNMGGAPTGVPGADAHCMGDANKPAGGSTYKALIVAPGIRVACTTANCTGGLAEHTDWVLAASTSYLRSNGVQTIMTTNSSSIFEFGTLSISLGTAGNYWSGLNADWTTGANCANWSNMGGTCAAGDSAATNGTAISNGAPAGTNFFSLICVEQ